MNRIEDTSGNVIIPLVIVSSLVGLVVAFAYDTFVWQPKRRAAYEANLIGQKADCVWRGGKVTEYNGGSVWSVSWACEGATKF